MPPRSANWRPDYYDALVHYLANPAEKRTIKEFSDENKVDEMTVYQFKRNHGDILWRDVDNVRKEYIPQIRKAAYDAIFSNIKKSFQDRKLALQLIGDLIERSEQVTSIKTPEEKRARIDELMKKYSANLDRAPENTQNNESK